MQLEGVDMLYLQSLVVERPESGRDAAYPQLPPVHNHISGTLPAHGQNPAGGGDDSTIALEHTQFHGLETPFQNDTMPEHPIGSRYEGTPSELLTTHSPHHFTRNNGPNLEDYAKFDPWSSFKVDFRSMEEYLPSEQLNIDNSAYQEYGQTVTGHSQNVNGWDQGMGIPPQPGHHQDYFVAGGDHYQSAAPSTPSIHLTQPNSDAATPSFEVISSGYETSFVSTPTLEASSGPAPVSNGSPASHSQRKPRKNTVRPKEDGPVVLVWDPVSGEQTIATRATKSRTLEEREMTKLIRRRGGACHDCKRNHRACKPEHTPARRRNLKRDRTSQFAGLSSGDMEVPVPRHTQSPKRARKSVETGFNEELVGLGAQFNDSSTQSSSSYTC